MYPSIYTVVPSANNNANNTSDDTQESVMYCMHSSGHKIEPKGTLCDKISLNGNIDSRFRCVLAMLWVVFCYVHSGGCRFPLCTPPSGCEPLHRVVYPSFRLCTHPSVWLPFFQVLYTSFSLITPPSGCVPLLQVAYPSFRLCTPPSGW